MRSAFLTHQWPGIRMGGIGSYIRQSALSLAAAGHEVHIFTLTLPEDIRAQFPAGIHLHPVPDLAARVHAGTLPAALSAAIHAGGEGLYRLALAWLLGGAFLEAHQQTPFDILETPDVEALGLPLMLNPNLSLPIITHLHCCTAIAHQANGTPITENERLITALEFAAIHLADARCAATQAVLRTTRKLMGLPLQAHILPHPFTCDSAPFAEPPADGPIIFIGRIERLKGVATIAAALNDFLPRHPAATFRFLGPDTSTAPHNTSMTHHLRATLSPQIAPRVTFTGELTHDQIAQELKQSSFAVLPSFSENFSMALCETLNAGRTAIVGAGTGSVELIGPAGLVTNPNSRTSLAAAMEQLWTNHPQLSDLSQQAYARVRTLCSPAATAAQRVQFYHHTIATFRPSKKDLPARLAHLPTSIAAALLPALSTLTGTLAGIALPPLTPGHRLLGILDKISQNNGKHPIEILLYGAGKHTARLLAEKQIWESRGHRVTGLIDDHPRFTATPHYLDLPVQSLRAAAESLAAGKKLPPVVLSTDTYQDQFWEQTAPLRERGTAVFRLYP